MSEQNFLYRPILSELTEVVKDKGLDPYEAYGWLYEKQKELGLHASSYLSTSITSGGHARDNSLEMREVVVRNTNSALLLASQLATDGQIAPRSAIEPVVVGKTHWNQAEYMQFWLSVIGGYQFTTGFIARDINDLRTAAQQQFSAEELDIDKMTSSKASDVRAAEYFKMSSAFASLITSGKDAKPIDMVIRMIDTDTSLGAQTERAFARLIGARVMNIVVMQPVTAEKLMSVNRRLAADTAKLIKFGATVFDTTTSNVRLVLTEAAA